MNPLVKLEFDESLHPRDERGKFAETGGTDAIPISDLTYEGEKVFDSDGRVVEGFQVPPGKGTPGSSHKSDEFDNKDRGAIMRFVEDSSKVNDPLRDERRLGPRAKEVVEKLDGILRERESSFGGEPGVSRDQGGDGFGS